MITYFCTSAQFQVRLDIDGELLERVHKTKLLGFIFSDDLKWTSNTESLVKREYTRMLILINFAKFQVPKNDMISLYKLYIQSISKQSCVVWGSSITEEDSRALEMVQKVALRIIYLEKYSSYNHALSISGLPKLLERRDTLS